MRTQYVYHRAPNGHEYRTRVREVGQKFAAIGQVIAKNGRIVAQTRELPYGWDGAAHAAARELIDTLR